jgi:16S rRNA (cytidine1402-2'-O)-methyltransferase
LGTLFVVATPIGNLEDLSPRALRTLREVSLIAAEDTRHSRGLLTHFGVETPLISYHEHNQRERRERLLRALDSGDVALITDAGTPAISDPGTDLSPRRWPPAIVCRRFPDHPRFRPLSARPD